VKRSLICFWVLFAASPLWRWATNGWELRTWVCGLFYLLGWLALWVGFSHDPDAEKLKSFGRSVVGRVAFGLGLVMLLAIGAAVSIHAALDTCLVLAATFGVLWAGCRSEGGLGRAVGRILLMSVPVVLLLSLVEICFRLPVVAQRTGEGGPDLERWASENYDRLWDKNPLKLRSLHLERPKPAGVFRIVALGDSFTWGLFIARTEDTWPYVAERCLLKDDARVQVLNLGYCGFTTVNEAERLDRLGWSLEPDFVVLQFTLNDPLPSGPNYWNLGEGSVFRLWPLIPIIGRWVSSHSYFYRYADAKYQSWQMRFRYPRGVAPFYDDEFAGWTACKTAIAAMAQSCKRRKVPMLVMIFPYFMPGKLDMDSYPYVQVHRKIEAAATASGLPVLDLLPIYASHGRDGQSWWVFPRERHPGLEAHRVAGEAVAGKIQQIRAAASAEAGR